MLNQYHALLNTPQADWEMLREHASQRLGNPVSPMWFPMAGENSSMQSVIDSINHPSHRPVPTMQEVFAQHAAQGLRSMPAPRHLQTIANLRTPQLAARYLEADAGDPEGGGFGDVLGNITNAAGLGAILYVGHKVGTSLGALGTGASGLVQQGIGLARRAGTATVTAARATGTAIKTGVTTGAKAAEAFGKSAAAFGQATGAAAEDIAKRGVVQGGKKLATTVAQGVDDLLTDVNPAQLVARATDDLNLGLSTATTAVEEGFDNLSLNPAFANLGSDLNQGLGALAESAPQIEAALEGAV